MGSATSAGNDTSKKRSDLRGAHLERPRQGRCAAVQRLLAGELPGRLVAVREARSEDEARVGRDGLGGVAVAVEDARTGQRPEQRVEVTDVPGGLQHPAPVRLAVSRQHAQLQGVVGVLPVEVATVEPARVALGVEHVVEVLTGEGVLQQRVALLRAAGGQRMHAAKVGSDRVEPLEPRFGLPHERGLVGSMAVLGRDRVQRLPEAEEPVARILRQQAVEQARARPRQAGDDHGTVERRLGGCGPAGQVGLDVQAVAKVAQEDTAQQPPAGRVEAAGGAAGLDEQRQRLREAQVAPVVVPRPFGRLPHQRRWGQLGHGRRLTSPSRRQAPLRDGRLSGPERSAPGSAR